ncbi:MAG TPA: hypothetical protein PLD51_00370 [Pontiellaceae bacterium]|nr:hypothetical protein [Pontiellaceae bacterium]
MKTFASSKKNGAVLVAVMVVLLAVTLMVAALLQLGAFGQIETVQQLRSAQAHWLAEAGLERALSRVMASRDYRAILPDSFSNDETLLNGFGGYDVEISKVYSNALLDTYIITSTGRVSNDAVSATGVVRLRMVAGPGGQQALMGLDGSQSTIAANVTVNGTIYQDGVLHIANGASTELNDIIDATGGITGNTGEATPGDLPDPIPGPRIEASRLTAYANMLGYAASTNAGAYPSGSAISLGGGTNYYNGSATIDKNVTGPGTIVVASNLTVAADIPANVNLIAGGIVTLGNKSALYGNNIVFTYRDIDISGGNFYGSFVSLLSMGGIWISAGIDNFKGILYADGLYRSPAQDGKSYGIIFKSGTQTIRGTVIAWEGFYMGSNATITYDPTVFANPNPINYGNTLAIQKKTWEEAPYN